MSEKQPGRHVRSGLSIGTVEVIVAALLFAIGLIVIHDSRRLGISWGSDGPQSGYFPFYIGLLICFSSVAIALQTLFGKLRNREAFVERKQLKSILSLLVPAAFYVALIHLLGIYLASAVYIALFMIWLGKYGITRSVATGIGVSTTLFLIFERWFAVPLPKGPIERWLGF